MTFKLVFAGLQSLRVCTPGLVFLGVAILLVLLPRRISTSAGTGTAIAASAVALLAMLVAPGPLLPERTDLVKDRLSQLGPIWLAVLLPMTTACLQRSTSIHRGVAVAGVHLTAGALCFAMAAKTPSLLILSLTLAMIGATTVPMAAESDIRGARLAGRTALFSALMWSLLLLGLSMAARSPAGNGPIDPRLNHSSHLVGAVLTTIALFGLLGWGPTSGWLLNGNIGVRTATATLYSIIASVALLKLIRLIHSEHMTTVLWAWSMASVLYHLWALRTTRFDDFASAAVGLWASVAIGLLVTARGEGHSEVVVGAFSLLIFVSILGPALGAAIDTCTLNLNGDLGNPADSRSMAIKTALFLSAGLPLSLGFWGLKLLASTAFASTGPVGLRQATMGLALLGAIAIGFGGLRQLSRLAGRPPAPPMDDECRWQLGASIAAAAVLVLIGLWPAPFISVLHEIVQGATSVLPAGPLKP
jgi:hypothetical protein